MLVTGAGGQVGTEVARELEGRAKVIALDRGKLDLELKDEIAAHVRDARPDVIVNCAAFTAVDRAESEPHTARAVNAIAPGILGEEAKRAGALLVHFSTDYVFDGMKRAPYIEDDPTHPLGVYGRTKLEGERAIELSGCSHVILRTSWVYGPHGANFMLTMLRLGATREELRIVADQRGAPTSSRELARLVHRLLGHGADGLARAGVDEVAERSGIYHATAGGETTWFGFAGAIFEEARRRRPAMRVPRLVAITTAEYPTAARRPANSVLSCARLNAVFGLAIPDWRVGLEEAVSALPAG
ncbi:MAG TPA: dTDP-4-dehydrorhamnose reductase [Usitatibacter sp.]|nr:dTDP-4-dehydrorhamnose reductase [Usitatibacter sp.]